ncbi:hypothetical protein DPMN_092098 [Dreissena polymorpha]|uniref:Uncharacterized protein n=1 Tax=Dreissena polymorpha TaxID=45954 RepID=A0A9D4L0Q0_DREPO|nr:hypothetical protein DPMN_092098 [Dreissena polymorpha]
MFNQFEHADVNDVFIATSSEDNYEWSANLKIGCKTVKFEIDSGAMCSVMSYGTTKPLEKVAPITRSDVIISGVYGPAVKALGMITLLCEHKNIKRSVNFQIMNTPRGINLLGRDDSVDFGLIMRIHTARLETESIIKKYSDVLGEEIESISQ